MLTYDHPGHGTSALPTEPCTVEAFAHSLLRPRRARSRARLSLRHVARRDGGDGARARSPGTCRAARPLVRPPTSDRPTAGPSARAPFAPEAWRRSQTPSSCAGSRPTSHASSRRRWRDSARCWLERRPKGYALLRGARRLGRARAHLRDLGADARDRRRRGPGDARRTRSFPRVPHPGRAASRPRARGPPRERRACGKFTNAVSDYLGEEVPV